MKGNKNNVKCQDDNSYNGIKFPIERTALFNKLQVQGQKKQSFMIDVLLI